MSRGRRDARLRALGWMVVAPILLSACQGVAPAVVAPTPQAGEQELKVAMFPWIPDAAGDGFAALWSYYEAEFETQNPSIDVTVGTDTGDYYDGAAVVSWLDSGTYDVVEIDMVMLGDVIATGALQPFWDVDIADRFFPPSVQSVQLDAEYWGVPHLMCTYYLLSRSADVAAATDFAELYTALGALPTVQRFAGNLSAGWDTSVLYIESFYQQERGSPEAAISNPVQPSVLSNLHELAELCNTPDGANPCTDGTYKSQFNKAATDFAVGTSATSFGYSERLWVVLTQAGTVALEDIRASALQMGSDNSQVVFTDAFVVSKNCTGSCLAAAMDWVDYVTSDDALGYMLASGDAGSGAVPRYLLPANLGALQYGSLPNDVYYPQFIDALVATSPQPSNGVPEYKEANGDEIANIIANGVPGGGQSR